MPTSDLTIDGVELVGISQMTEPEMATFLEAIVKRAKLSPVAYIMSVGSRQLDWFVEPHMNRNNSHYMHRPNPAEGDGKERHDYKMLQALRRKGLRLTSPWEDWVRECGWTGRSSFSTRKGM